MSTLLSIIKASNHNFYQEVWSLLLQQWQTSIELTFPLLPLTWLLKRLNTWNKYTCTKTFTVIPREKTKPVILYLIHFKVSIHPMLRKKWTLHFTTMLSHVSVNLPTCIKLTIPYWSMRTLTYPPLSDVSLDPFSKECQDMVFDAVHLYNCNLSTAQKTELESLIQRMYLCCPAHRFVELLKSNTVLRPSMLNLNAPHHIHTLLHNSTL